MITFLLDSFDGGQLLSGHMLINIFLVTWILCGFLKPMTTGTSTFCCGFLMLDSCCYGTKTSGQFPLRNKPFPRKVLLLVFRQSWNFSSHNQVLDVWLQHYPYGIQLRGSISLILTFQRYIVRERGWVRVTRERGLDTSLAPASIWVLIHLHPMFTNVLLFLLSFTLFYFFFPSILLFLISFHS